MQLDDGESPGDEGAGSAAANSVQTYAEHFHHQLIHNSWSLCYGSRLELFRRDLKYVARELQCH